MTTLNELKAEYKLAGSGDAWGDCMGAWFAISTELAIRGDDVPSEWGYSAGAFGPHHEEGDYWAEVIADVDSAVLLEFGGLLYRLSGILKAAGRDY